jgi:hypothetical protein
MSVLEEDSHANDKPWCGPRCASLKRWDPKEVSARGSHAHGEGLGTEGGSDLGYESLAASLDCVRQRNAIRQRHPSVWPLHEPLWLAHLHDVHWLRELVLRGPQSRHPSLS